MFHFVPEAEALPCDDVSRNSKSTISVKTNERTSDEAASTLSTSTPVEHLVSYAHNDKSLVHVIVVCHV